MPLMIISTSIFLIVSALSTWLCIIDKIGYGMHCVFIILGLVLNLIIVNI